jgi:hypothetical protein
MKSGDSSEHEPGARQSDEGDGDSVEVSVFLGEAVAAIDPGDGAFHDQRLGVTSKPLASAERLTTSIRQAASTMARPSIWPP